MAEKPSVSAVRKARRNYAMAQSRKEMADMQVCMSKMEERIESLACSLLELQSKLVPKQNDHSKTMECPPGLQNFQDAFDERVSLLE